jgi:acetyl/propionyl-CoA carboxylase alpha subunit
VILEIDCGKQRIKVEVRGAHGSWKVAVDGKAVPCDWVALPNGHASLILDGCVYDFLIEAAGDGCSVIGRGGTHALRVTDARRLRPQREVEEGVAGLQRLTAEMPGKVVRILVKEGDTVSYDQGLLVLEAMKMQNEIRAPKSGLVKTIGVTPGKAVSTGEFLLSLE